MGKFIENMGSTGFDSRTYGEISKSSAEIKLVNNMFQILNGENNYALAA